MNIVVAHGYAHRRLSNGMIESAPFDSIHDEKAWEQRGIEEMDLTGGDFELVANVLEQLSYVFALDSRRTPVVVKQEEVPVETVYVV